MKKMKSLMVGACALVGTQLLALAGEPPAVLGQHFSAEAPVKAQIFTVIPPDEFDSFVQKLSEVAQKDGAWYAEHSKKTPAGSPIPLYDEKLGMSQDEYDAFVKLWDSREAKKLADVLLVLEEEKAGSWKINASGEARALTLLRYNGETNTFSSPNGELVAIADVNAPESSLLGAWKGKEWRYLSENSLTQMKENIALGKTADGKYSILIYRIQEVTAKGRPLFDKSLLIRFVAKK